MQIVTTANKYHKVKLAVYGMSGVGKTVLCSTAPKPIIISAEAGLLSLAHKDIPAIEITSFKELGEAYSYLKENILDYDTICLDSISDICEQCFSSTLDEINKQAEETGKNPDPRQAYGKMALRMMSVTRSFRALPTHIVFTAKQGQVQDNIANTLRFGPMLTGQVYTQNLPYLMDLVCCMRVDKQGNRFLQFQPDIQYLAKDRSGKLDKMEEPNLTNIFNKVLNND